MYLSHFLPKQIFEHKFKVLLFSGRLTSLILLFGMDIWSDKLLFKNYFHSFDFANMNDRMTGASTAFGLLYNVNLDCLVSSLFLVNSAEQKIIFVIFLDTVKTYQNYRWNEFVFLVNTIIDDERRLTLDLTHNNTS